MASTDDRRPAQGRGLEPVQRLLLKPAEAAASLAISERTLWTIVQRGEIRALRIGAAVRYSPEDLAAWVERMRGDGAAHGQHCD